MCADADAESDESDRINLSGERYIPAGYEVDLYKVRHSAAHVLAQAVEEHFREEGPMLFGIGPPSEDGFYYDFVLPRSLSDEELPQIEERMRAIAHAGYPFKGWEVDGENARAMFAGQPFKAGADRGARPWRGR
jgi:threonyl-tRNA synthetase